MRLSINIPKQPVKTNHKQSPADWAKQQLAAKGYQEIVGPEIIREMPWSKVSRFETSKGPVYLKQAAKPFAIEGEVLRFLFENVNKSVTEMIAASEYLSCFLTKNAGQVLRDIQKQNFQSKLFCEALRICAQIQRSSIPHIKSLIAIGVNDWRLEKLPALYREFMTREDLLETDGLTSREIQSLQSFLPQIHNLCEQLSAYKIPETIEHGDFQDNNILIQDDKITISDWGDVCISHPFISLASALNSAIRNHNLQRDGEIFSQAKNAYLETWLDYETKRELQTAFLIVEKLQKFLFALSFSRIWLGNDIAKLDPYKGYMANSLRHLLD